MEKKVIKEKESSFLISDEEKKAFGKRLESLIPNRGLSKFANKACIAESTLRSLIGGKSQPRLDNLISIANAGDVTVEWLATGRGVKTYAELCSPYDAVPTNETEKPALSVKEEAPIYNRPSKITVDVVQNISTGMIKLGLINKELQIAIDYFAEIYNRTSDTNRSEYAVTRAILEYQIRLCETQLYNFGIEGGFASEPEKIKDYKEYLGKLLADTREQLAELNKSAENGKFDF